VRPQCEGANARGMPCRSFAMPGDVLCWVHRHPEKWKAAQRRGGHIGGGMKKDQSKIASVHRLRSTFTQKDIEVAFAQGLVDPDVRVRLLAAALLVKISPRHSRPTLAGITSAMLPKDTEAAESTRLEEALEPGLELWKSLPQNHPLRRLYQTGAVPRVFKVTQRDRQLERVTR
jgi:hypothetical protein